MILLRRLDTLLIKFDVYVCAKESPLSTVLLYEFFNTLSTDIFENLTSKCYLELLRDFIIALIGWCGSLDWKTISKILISTFSLLTKTSSMFILSLGLKSEIFILFPNIVNLSSEFSISFSLLYFLILYLIRSLLTSSTESKNKVSNSVLLITSLVSAPFKFESFYFILVIESFKSEMSSVYCVSITWTYFTI